MNRVRLLIRLPNHSLTQALSVVWLQRSSFEISRSGPRELRIQHSRPSWMNLTVEVDRTKQKTSRSCKSWQNKMYFIVLAPFSWPQSHSSQWSLICTKGRAELIPFSSAKRSFAQAGSSLLSFSPCIPAHLIFSINTPGHPNPTF